MKRVLWLMTLMAVFAWSGEAAPAAGIFNTATLGVEGGVAYPLDDVQEVVDNSYYGLVEFRYHYVDSLSGVVQFGYSYFNTNNDSVPFPGVHQFNGRVGLDFPPPVLRPISFGVGFSCIWMRADGSKEEVSNSTLDDNESEFGWYVRMNLPIVLLSHYRVGARVYYETLWTEPQRSQMLWFGLYLERKLW